MLRFTAQMQGHVAVFHAEPAGPNVQYRVAFPRVTLGKHIQPSGQGGVIQPLLPVVGAKGYPPAQRHTREIPVPAPVADVQLLRGDLPRQVEQRIGIIPRHHHQLTLIVFPVQIGIDQRRQLWHVKGRDRVALHRHAIRYQRQGKLAHQLNRLRLVRELDIELADRERLTAKRAFNADLLAFIGDLLNGRRQRRMQLALPLLPGRQRQTVNRDPGIR